MKIKNFVLTTIVIILLIQIIPLAQAYENSTLNFSITQPSGWDTQENYQGFSVAFLGPADPDIGNVIITVYAAKTDLTLDATVSKTKQDWSTTFADYSLVSEGGLKINDHNGYEIEFSAQNGGVLFKQDSVLFVENGQLFQVSYTAGPTNYDTYFDTYTQSIKTFQIQSSGFSFGFNFEITGIPFLLLIAAIVVVVIVVVVWSRKRKTNVTQSFSPPPPS